MLLYSILMFAISALLLVMSIMIYKGNTNLIHDYHQEKVKDKLAYGRAFGKALAVVATAPLFSGIVGLLGDSETVVLISILILIVIMGVGFGCIIAVQKKYNKGIF